MRNRTGLLAALSLSMSAAATAHAAEPVSFPPYQEVDHLDRYATESEYRAAVSDKDFVLERIAYPSGDLEVFAYVYRPAEPGERLPVIVFNRGSWTWPSFHAELVTMANRLAHAGYLVVAPMYRGSGGAKGRDELGGADLADLFNLLPVIRALPYADTRHIYLYGESRGGMMVYQAIRDGFPARAAAVVGAFTDFEAVLADPKIKTPAEVIWPELKQKRAEIATRRSAQLWADKINTPILILHGAMDTLSPLHSLKMAERLSALNRPYQLMIIDGEGHTLKGRAADRDAWVIDWFKRH